MPPINRRLSSARYREIKVLAGVFFITLIIVQVCLALRLSRLNDATLSADINGKTQIDSTEEERLITPSTSDGTLQGKERLWEILSARNVTKVYAKYWDSVPQWDTILNNIHRTSNDPTPLIHGLETCEQFQRITSENPTQRRIAPAGLFNTGTNLLSVLLEYNCQNPHRVAKFHGNAKRGHGNEWQVPWGKHLPARHRGAHVTAKNPTYTVDEVLPVVLIRNPYGWMKSMCRNPYTASFEGRSDPNKCPKLKKENNQEWNSVKAKFGPYQYHHHSLAHLYNDWYGDYFYKNSTGTESEKSDTSAPFPRLIVRFEDLIFFPYEVTTAICKCAGGQIAHRADDKDVANGTFHYVVRSAKAGMGHGPTGHRNGLIDSWIRYGSASPQSEYSQDELALAQEVLDPHLMDTFAYSK